MKKLLLGTLLLIVTVLSSAQTITIGSGTQTNGYNEASPVNITRDRSVSWIVYTVAELNAAGITGPATINRMGFFVTNIPVNDIPDYTIQMKHTNAASAGDNPGNTGYTVVKNAFTYAPNQGDWDMLDLDTPFDWNGTQNIAIKICWSNANNDPSGQLRVFNSTNGYRYRWTDAGSGSYCGFTPNTNRQWKPQIRFVFDTETIWTGVNGTNWFNSGNWTAGIPDATMDARIPVGAPNYPILTGTASTAKFTLEGSMTNNITGVLNVYGDFENTGTYTDLGGQTVLTGDGPNLISNSSALEITNLIIESKFGAAVTGSLVTITDELQVNKSIFNTNDLIIMKSDANGTARIAPLTTNCFYELVMNDDWGDGWNGATLTILEDGVPISVVQAYGSTTTEIIPVANGAVLQLQYASGQFENENAYTLYDPTGTPIFSDGPYPATGTVFTTTSTCGFTPPISGTISMERYVDAGETYWRYFGSAVTGATVAQYNDDFTTAGYPGSHWPSFPFVSVYTYDETLGPGLGYLPCSGATQVMQPGQGYQVWCGDTITGTQPFTVDLVGVPTQGDVALPVTYTNTGTPTEDGWNHISNPYPSAIDWDAAGWTKSSLANAVYIQNPDNQQYATYVAGASTNGGSRYIASQQSFWVYAFAPTPVLNASESVKSDVNANFFKAGTTLSPGLTIRLLGNQEFDEAVMRHVDGATDDLEYAYDAKKWWGGWGLYPQVSLINGQNEDLTVHSFDKSNMEWSVPLRAIVFQDGVYGLEFDNVSELDIPCLKLEDTYTGQIYDITDGTYLSFEMSDTTYAPRFILHMGRNYDLTSTPATCYGDGNGSVEIDLDDAQSFDYIMTFNGNPVPGGNTTGDPMVINNLVSGIYTVEIPGLSNLCDYNGFSFVINQPSPIQVSATITEETFGNDGAIALQVNGGTAPYSFSWDHGSADEDLSGLMQGTYMVSVSDANGCEWEGSFMVNSVLSVAGPTAQSVYVYLADQNAIQISGWSGGIRQLGLYSISGELIAWITTTDVQVQTLVLPGGMAEGVYFIANEGDMLYKFGK